MSAICARLSRERGENQRGETAGVYPLVRPRGVSALPAAGRGESPRSAERNSPLRFSEKLPARQRRTRLRSSRPPLSRCRKTPTRFASPGQPVPKNRLRGSHFLGCPMPRKRKRHRSRGASPFCGYVGRSAAAVAAITAAAAGIITTGTAGTAAAAALTAAYPDQDDQDDDPPPGIFAPEAVRRTHTVISSYQRFHYILW